MRSRFSLVGVQWTLAALVPGMFDRFADAILEVGVVMRLDFLEAGQVASGDVTAREGKLGVLAIERNVRHRDVVDDATPDGRPLGIEATYHSDIDQVDVFHEVAELIDPFLHRQ
ncbi:MAG: hypothetical protein AW09_003053 [Candidatus Accumulibacter phosphatis]|uniref:Uncharacterized protein n=1 Tax=Candidatus Accumulibacter phosphatis TaxID=327160 RepID=A0A080LVR4_9PROT|nr:MAG: hypothetical protein AW09_003053 [Candidatus Accumulibacter phosphatis]